MEFLLSPASIERVTIVVSGKNLCLSVTQFLMACNSETVEEIDTKLVPPRLQHLQMCSALKIFLQGQDQGQLVRSFNYSFRSVTQTFFDRHLCSFTCMFLISGACVATQFGYSAQTSRSFLLVSAFLKIYHLNQFTLFY